VQSIGGALKAKGFSEGTAATIRAAWRPTTEKQYATYVARWSAHCSTKKISVLQPTLVNVLEFLQNLFIQGLSLSAINTARSTISFLAAYIDSKPVGEHPLVCRFMKGVRRLRPPLPRYTCIWDTNIVVEYMANMTHTDLKEITLKITMLLALLTAQRAQTVHALRLRNMTLSENSFKFEITDLMKNMEPGEAEICLHRFTPDSRLCIVTLMEYYLLRTEPYRKVSDDRLILVYIKPHGPATVDTIRRYILRIMERAGIDIAIFKPHSTRAAATSAANRKNVPVRTIMANAMWRSSSTFAKFYNKPLYEEEVDTGRVVFQDSILRT
jgi:site-specific recombinase XerD